MTEAACLALGVLLGAALAMYANERSFRLAARFHATGTVPLEAADRDARITGSAEANALREVDEDSIRRGADQIEEAYKNQGLTISRKEAEAEARSLIGNAQPLGGAH